MLESKVEAHLVKRVKALGGEVRKVQWVGRRGAPDRLVMLPARNEYRTTVFGSGLAISGTVQTPAGSTWVELKRPGGKVEAHQRREHERMHKMGQGVLVLDSIEAVDQWLGV